MLQHRPLVVLCAGFIAGILIAVDLGGSALLYGVICIASLAWLALDGKRAIIAALLASLAVGSLRTVLVTTRSSTDISHYAPVQNVKLLGVIDGEPSIHRSSVQFVLACDQASTDDQRHSVSGRVQVVGGTSGDDGMPSLHDGDRVSFTGSLELPRGPSNPGALSWASSLGRRAIWAEAHVYGPITIIYHAQDAGFADFALGVRQRLLSGLSESLSPRDDGILNGVLFGLRSDIPPPAMGAFIATGTVHILATAGLHIGVIVLLLGWAGHLIGAPRKGTAAGSIALLWMYDIMAGGRPAVTRAVIVATIYLGATIFERAPEVLTSLAAAALFILFLQPTALLDPGFQMSFFTVLTLAALLPIWHYCLEPIREKMHYKLRKLAGIGIDLVGMCIAAQIGAGPIVAREFHILPLYSVCANLIVVPLVFVLIPTGLAVALASVVSTSAAGFIAAGTVTPIISAILWTVKLFGSGPGASMPVGDFPDWALFLYYLFVCGGGFVWQQKMAQDRRRSVHASAVDPGSPVLVHTA